MNVLVVGNGNVQATKQGFKGNPAGIAGIKPTYTLCHLNYLFPVPKITDYY